MKTKEEFNALKEEELTQVSGGATEQELLQIAEEQLRKLSQQQKQELIDEIDRRLQLETELQ